MGITVQTIAAELHRIEDKADEVKSEREALADAAKAEAFDFPAIVKLVRAQRSSKFRDVVSHAERVTDYALLFPPQD